jgi:hypothetical protein
VSEQHPSLSPYTAGCRASSVIALGKVCVMAPRLICLVRGHKWRVDYSDRDKPVEVCDRCGHHRKIPSRTDFTTRAENRPNDPPFGTGGGP